jgi:hypothetical protein
MDASSFSQPMKPAQVALLMIEAGHEAQAVVRYLLAVSMREAGLAWQHVPSQRDPS